MSADGKKTGTKDKRHLSCHFFKLNSNSDRASGLTYEVGLIGSRTVSVVRHVLPRRDCCEKFMKTL